MNVLIIWSGKTSKAIAKEFRDWLPQVIQAVKPWMSDKDIDKGANWHIQLAKKLKDVNFGIVCLTPDNLREPWILFESGATSNAVGEAHVSPYLFELKTTDVTGPLAQFQMAKADKEDTLKLIQSINLALGDQALQEDTLQKVFDKWWPEFEKELLQIKTEAKEEHTEVEPKRTDSDKLDEILNEVRQIAKEPTWAWRNPGDPQFATYAWESGDYLPTNRPIKVVDSEGNELEYWNVVPNTVMVESPSPKRFVVHQKKEAPNKPNKTKKK